MNKFILVLITLMILPFNELFGQLRWDQRITFKNEFLRDAKDIAQDSCRKYGRDSSIALKNVMDDTARKYTRDSTIAIKGYIKDTITAKLPIYQLFPLEKFAVDTGRTIRLSGTAKSDTINHFRDFRGDTAILGIATDDSAYSRRQNCSMLGRISIGYGVNSVDTVKIKFRTKQSPKDSNSVNFYVGEQNILTRAITWIDSVSTDTAKTSWTQINLKPTNVTKGDILVMMVRVWCIGLNYVYMDEPVIVQR